MDIHPAALIFPEMENAEYLALRDDIEINGQHEEIVLCAGKILDGRHRFRACEELGRTPRTRTHETDDPIGYVLSANLHRRHLTPSQRSMVGARARAEYDRAAKERQKTRKGNQPGATKENLPELSTGQARDQVGKVMGVSGKSIDHATKVLNNAIPEIVEAVDQGRMAVSEAAILASEPDEVQRKEAKNPRRNRDYKSVSKRLNGEVEQPETDDLPQPGKQLGVGVIRAHEAINSLTRIPKNDALRKQGFRLVTDWIRRNP
jgi:hypothetical protein